MGRWFAILGVSLVCVALAAGAPINTPAKLTIAPGGCSAIEIDGLLPKFGYQIQWDGISEQSCANTLKISKFYMQGACIKDRNNQISLDSVKDLTCTEAKGNDQESCKFAFSEAGPADAKILVSNLTNNQTFDTGNICADETTGYIFVQSNCTTSTDVTVTFQAQTYEGPICLDVGGHHLSGWAIGIIVVAAFIVLLIAFWLVWCCCCKSCCCCC